MPAFYFAAKEVPVNAKVYNQTMRNAFHAKGYKGKHIIFAIIDSGVNPVGWLKGKVRYSSLFPATDTNGHGTFVAGQLIEWCPEAAVLSYNVLPNGTGKVSDTNAALADILKRVKADTSHQYIVNMSLGGGGSAVSPSIVQQGKLISQLVDENVPVCVSAGNDGKEAKLDVWPSCFHDPVCVAAINDNGAKANFSTWHNEIDVADAGVSIKGLSYTGASGVYMSGTSMSAPNVAGKIGLIMSKYYTDNGDWPSEPAVYDTLKNNCIDLHKKGYDPYTGYGFVYMDGSVGVQATYGICAKTTGNVRLRQGASTLTASLAVVPKGTPIIICAHNAGWHKCTAFIGGKCVVGYISTKYVKEVK